MEVNNNDEGLVEDAKKTKALLDKLVGGNLDLDSYFLIRNATTIQEIFGKDFFGDENVHAFAKAKVLDDITHIVAKSSRNRYVCCNWGLLDLLLDLIPTIPNEILFDKVLKLISILGTHNVSVANLKQCLRLLEVNQNTELPFDTYHAKLLATFDTMTFKQGPNEFFDLDGENSGIKISNIEKWPNNYSISTWVCVESFEHPDKAKNQYYEPRLFCFLSAQGNGVEAFFLRDSLAVRTNGSNKLQVKKFKFTKNRWYHVCIVHTYQWWMLGTSTVQVYINGVLMEQGGLKYPNTNQTYTMCYLGTALSMDTAFMYIPKDCTLCGTIGPTMLFSGAITQNQVDDLYKSGPNAVIVPYHKENSILFQGFPKLIFSFSPKGSSGGVCQDLGHSLDNEVYCSAQTMGTTFVQQTLGWNDSMFCAGGIQLLLPIFQQFSLYPDKVNYTLASSFLFLAHALESMSNQYEFAQIHGFSIIGYLMEGIDSKAISNECVGALDILIGTVSKNDWLQREAYEHLAMNLRVWNRAPFEVQILHFNYIQTKISKSPAYFKEFFGTRTILDILREHYNFSETDPSTHEQTRKLRAELFKIMKVFMKADKQDLKADFKAIVGYLQDCTNCNAMSDMLQFLLGLAIKHGKQYIAFLETSGGYATFMNLIGRDMEEVRILAVKMIGCLLKDGSNKARSKFFNFYGHMYIAEILKTYPFNEATYRALTEVLVGKISLEPTAVQGLLEMIGTSGCFANPQFLETILVLTSTTDTAHMQTILTDISVCLRHNPSVCDAVTTLPSWHEFMFTLLYAAVSGTAQDIFDPGSKLTDAEHIVSPTSPTTSPILATFPIHLPKSPSAPKVLLHSTGAKERPPTVSLHNTDPLKSTVIELIMDIFNVVLHQCLFKKDGWKAVEEVLSVMYACSMYFDDMVGLERKLLYDLLESLTEELRRIDSTRHTPLVRNAVNIGCLVDDFLYNSENQLAHRNGEGHWEDFSLALKFLFAYDITLKHHQQYQLQQQQQQQQLQQPHNVPFAPQGPQSTLPIRSPSDPGIGKPKLVSSMSFPQPANHPASPHFPRPPNPFATLQQLPKGGLTPSPSEYPSVELYKGKSFANILYRIVLLVFQESLDISHSVKNPSKESVHNIWNLPSPPPLEQVLEKNANRVRIMLNLNIFGIGSKDHKEEVKRVLALVHHLVKIINRARKIGITPMDDAVILLRDILRAHAKQIDQFYSGADDWRIVESPPAFAESVGAAEFMEYFDKGLQLNFSFLDKMKSAAVDFEKDERPAPTQVAGRRQKSLDSARLSLLKERDSVRSKVLKFQAEVYGTIQKQNVVESTHKSSRSRMFYFHRNRTEKRWKKINKVLTINNLLAPSNAKPDKIFWRLSSYENARRMRKIMAAHLSGTDHSEHSLYYEGPSIMETMPDVSEEEERQDTEGDAESGDDWIFLDQNMSSSSSNSQNQPPASPSLPSEPFSSDSTHHHIHIHPETAQECSCVHSYSCEMLLGITVFKGRLCVTKQVLFFTPDFEVATAAAAGLSIKPKNKAWLLNSITSVRSRKYLLLDLAVELFFENATSRFFILEDIESQKQVMKFILTAVPSAAYDGQDALKVATQKWKKREITNFEYLIQLNTIAGRTFNDFNQYFIFPWVIMDYSSNKLDLNDLSIYRDLTKPVGALNETRLQLFLERWQQCPSEIPPFHYGTHYSNAGAVLFYLMRVEPFTELFVLLQGGKFDIADRMFTSISDCLRNCLTSTSDVKELIPEFFYFPEFLENLNHIDFGKRQNGELVSEVGLPPWASTAQEFVDISRKALESEFVSQNLHHWIDLIFGYKQKGKPAEEAINVFYHLTYAGSVDVNTLSDPILREATRVQLNNFGVTPNQLFKEPHPRRELTVEKANTVFTKFSGLRSSGETPINFQSASSIFYSGDRIVVFGAYGEVTSKKLVNGNIVDITTGTASFSSTVRVQVGKPYVMFPNNPKLVIATGKWENHLLVVNGEKVTSTVNLWCHKKPISVLALTEDSCTLVSGSFDGTIATFAMRNEEISTLPIHLLRGHDSEITCLCVSSDLDVCISGSTDKTVMVHSLRKGTLLHTIPHPEGKAVHQIALSLNTGKLVVYSYERSPQDNADQFNNLYLYSLNGQLLHQAHNPFYISSMQISADGEHLVLVGENCICLRNLNTLAFIHKVDISRNWVIACACVSPDEKYLWVVAENVEVDNCRLFLFTVDKPMLEPLQGTTIQHY